MSRILVVLGVMLCALSSIQAQQKNTASKIDSLAKHFYSAKTNAAKIQVMLNAPTRINEYFEKPDPILKLYKKALVLAESIGDKKSTISLLIEIAYFETYITSDEPKAFQLYSKALTYAEEEKDYTSCAIISFELAAINEHQNLRNEMYKYFSKAIEFNQKSQVLYLRPYRWAYAMYLEDNRINEALEVGRQAVRYVDERSAPAEFKALAYGYYYAVLKRMPNKQKEAAIYKNRIVELLRQFKTISETNQSDDIATVCYEVEQYKLAIFFANQLFTKTDMDSQLDASKIHCYEMLSASYERLGDYPKSLEFYKEYSTTYVKVLKNMLTLESGRKVIRAEGERNLLMKQNEVEKERFYRNLSFAIAAFVLLLGGVIVVFYKREQRQKQELTQLNATKDKLFAILSHDLRSPVGALENNVMLTNWGALTQDEFVETTQNLGQEIRQVRTMLDNVLHWSISQLGGMKPHPKTTFVLPIIEAEIKLLHASAQAKGIKMTSLVAPEAQLMVDSNHLAIIIRNLLQNAIKFTPTQGEISIKSAEKEKQFQLEIKDTGIGISQEQLRKLFTINESSSQQGTSQEKGTGLGLVLVKELVVANKGTIEIRSEIGKGCTCSITFQQS
ncbi:signal transduction histidine kinase [Runella defluvii]|uniref:histidine kinase n=1 Tax=Runella defluvii TaxID=370973 RepID=A0A7W5ZKT9_9BACT|nr:HAMP domain-containing sensor histidine kinase [Runella defluvii]MBB3838555.1 signal transduction histidine kinase [Runella defluvii]